MAYKSAIIDASWSSYITINLLRNTIPRSPWRCLLYIWINERCCCSNISLGILFESFEALDFIQRKMKQQKFNIFTKCEKVPEKCCCNRTYLDSRRVLTAPLQMHTFSFRVCLSLMPRDASEHFDRSPGTDFYIIDFSWYCFGSAAN